MFVIDLENVGMFAIFSSVCECVIYYLLTCNAQCFRDIGPVENVSRLLEVIENSYSPRGLILYNRADKLQETHIFFLYVISGVQYFPMRVRPSILFSLKIPLYTRHTF